MRSADFVTLLRLGLSPWVAWLVFHRSPLVIPAFTLAFLTDFLDGYLARHYGPPTKWGKILDPIADKVFAGGILLALSGSDRIPHEWAALVVARDAALLIGSLLMIRAGDPVPMPNRTGKISFAILGVYLFAVACGAVFPVPMGLTVVGIYLLTGVTYAGRLFEMHLSGYARGPR